MLEAEQDPRRVFFGQRALGEDPSNVALPVATRQHERLLDWRLNDSSTAYASGVSTGTMVWSRSRFTSSPLDDGVRAASMIASVIGTGVLVNLPGAASSRNSSFLGGSFRILLVISVS